MPTFSEPVDFSKQEARNLVTHKLASAPSSPVAGQRYYDTTSNKEGVYNGSSWDYAGSGSTGLGLLVYAQQNTEVTWSAYASFTIPFSTEVIDSQNLFSGGLFAPIITGLYRISWQIVLSASGSLGYYAIDLNSISEAASTKIYAFVQSESYSGGVILLSTSADIILTVGLAYRVSIYATGADPKIPVGTSIKNSLTIERLS